MTDETPADVPAGPQRPVHSARVAASPLAAARRAETRRAQPRGLTGAAAAPAEPGPEPRPRLVEDDEQRYPAWMETNSDGEIP